MGSGVTMDNAVLVTGATGFIGRDLIHRLAAAGWRVRAAARNPQSIQTTPAIEAFPLGDLSGPVDWSALLEGMTHVVPLAGIAHAGAATPESAYVAVNAQAVRRLAEAARAKGIRRVVLLSSVRAQTGPVAAGIVRESDAPRPTDAYGRSKLAAERALVEVLDRSATDWVVLRPVIAYGAAVKGNMRKLFGLARTPLPLPFAGLNSRRSLLSLGNLASGVAHVLLAEEASRGTYLVADPEPVTVPEMIKALRHGLGRPPGLVRVPLGPARRLAQAMGRADAWDRLAGDLVVDTSALRATGWQPTQDSLEGLAAAIRADQVLR